MTVTITAGAWVYVDHRFGICVHDPKERRPNSISPFVLCHVERLAQMAGWDELAGIVCRNIGAPTRDVLENVKRARWAMDVPIVRDCWHGGMPPLEGIDEITIEDLEKVLRDIEIAEAGKAAKREHSRKRRNQFQYVRSDRVLALLDSGVPYVCVHPGCEVSTQLTLDHKKPLSRGGSDDLENLQFMCVSHNSQKRDTP